MRNSVKDVFRQRSTSFAPEAHHADPSPDAVHGRPSIASMANGAAAPRMSMKPGLPRSSTLKRGSVFGGNTPQGGGAATAPADQQLPISTLRTGLERLMMRLDGTLRRVQLVAMVPGARVLTCDKNVATGAYEVLTGVGGSPYSSPHYFEIVEHLLRELTPHAAEDPCIVACMCWHRGHVRQDGILVKPSLYSVSAYRC